MAKPFNALVSQVINDVSQNAMLTTTLNRAQVGDALVQMMATLLRQYALQGKSISMEPFCQVLPDLPVELHDFTRGGLLPGQFPAELGAESDLRALGLPVEQLRHVVRLPELLNWGGFTGMDKPAISYLGPARGRINLDIYTGEDYQYAGHRRAAGAQPFALIIGRNAWLFSRRPITWPSVVLRAALADPRDSGEFGVPYNEDEDPYPAPPDFADEAVKQLINKYIYQYGRYSGTPRQADGNHLTS